MSLFSSTAKTDFSELLTNLGNVFLNDTSEYNDSMLSIKLFYS